MSLPLFLDHCVIGSVAESLRAAGHLVLILREYLPTDSPDPVVIAKAQELDAILVSNNGDFADLVTYPPGRYGGIIALQVHNRPTVLAAMASRLISYLAEHSDRDHYRGKLLLIESHRIRLRQ